MFYAFILSLVVFVSPCLAVQEKYIPVKDAELFCRIEGAGSPLVIIHGGAGYLTHEYLLPHVEKLADKHCVVLYDQRGLGKSTGELIPEQINLKTYVEDIESIRKSLGFSKISLMGHSFGGLVALFYASSYPESVDKVILSNSMVATSDDLPLFFSELFKRTAPFQQEIQMLETSPNYLEGDPKTVMEVNRLYYQTYMYDPLDICKLHLLKTQKENLNGAKVWDIFKTELFMKPFDFLPDIKKIHCPTLVIHGQEDVLPLIGSERVHQAIPNAKLVKIERCGHFPFVEQPQLFFQTVEEFLAKPED